MVRKKEQLLQILGKIALFLVAIYFLLFFNQVRKLYADVKAEHPKTDSFIMLFPFVTYRLFSAKKPIDFYLVFAFLISNVVSK